MSLIFLHGGQAIVSFQCCRRMTHLAYKCFSQFSRILLLLMKMQQSGWLSYSSCSSMKNQLVCGGLINKSSLVCGCYIWRVFECNLLLSNSHEILSQLLENHFFQRVFLWNLILTKIADIYILLIFLCFK